jgi:hypothetical protein
MRGESTHHTVTQVGYRIAEFHHSSDANFCDQVHNNFPKILEYIRQLEKTQSQENNKAA